MGDDYGIAIDESKPDEYDIHQVIGNKRGRKVARNFITYFLTDYKNQIVTVYYSIFTDQSKRFSYFCAFDIIPIHDILTYPIFIISSDTKTIQNSMQCPSDIQYNDDKHVFQMAVHLIFKYSFVINFKDVFPTFEDVLIKNSILKTQRFTNNAKLKTRRPNKYIDYKLQ